MRILIIKTLVVLVTCLDFSYAAEIIINNNSLKGSITIKSWKSLRDEKIVKQDLDYSCGAASISTVLTEFYQKPTSEKEVLELLLNVNGKKGKASFSDMEKVLPKLGFKGIGLATSWEKLLELKIPVILYVLQRKQDHFTVVSGINERYVRLSDPSLGNRTLTRGQFRKIWETRSEEGLEGKMLAILPLDKELLKQADKSFVQEPSLSHIPKELLLLNRQ